MPFNVSEFRAQMQGDGARPNLFEVSLPFPTTAVPGSANAQRKLTFMARTTSLPGSTLGTTSLQYFGREIKLVGNRTFADWTITIINDEDFVVRTALEAWMNAISSHAFNRRNSVLQSATSYTVDGKVTQYGKAGDVLRTYNMIGCFPTDLSPIDLDWSSNDTIEEFTVTFQYQWWESPEAGIL
jgi:hypothetical protein